MITLSVHVFDTPHAGQRKVRLLEARPGRRLTADDAAVITWPATADRPTAWQASPISSRNTLTGAFWGLLFAHLFLIPISCSEPPDIPLEQFDDALAPLGVTAESVADIRSMMTPGTSAVLVLHSDESLDALSAVLGGRDQSHVAIMLDPVQSRRLLAGFAERPAPD